MSNQDLEEKLVQYSHRNLDAKKTWYSKVVNAYDKVRPRYSDRLIDKAIQYSNLSPNAKLLEIGCGVGIATVSLAARGYQIEAIEPNAEACAIARQNCSSYPSVEFSQTTLEEWKVKPSQYDAVVAATSIHWVNPEIGYPKLAQALKDNGSLILLWNAGLHPTLEVRELLKPIYQQFAPTLEPSQPREEEKESLAALGQKVIDSGYFHSVFNTETIVNVTYSIEDYLLLLSTYSPYIALETQQREILFNAIASTLQQHHIQKLSLYYLSMLQVFRLEV